MHPSILIGLTSKCVYIPESHVAYVQDEPTLHVMPGLLTDMVLTPATLFDCTCLERHESCRSKSHSAIVAYSYHLVT
jgi:hypothetical protein